MLTMTTFRQIYNAAAGLAEHGRGLPAAEQLAWRALAVQLQELADQVRGYSLVGQAPADYAERVQALHDQLATTDKPAALLAARWMAGWLAEHADPAVPRARVQTLALVPAPQLAGHQPPPSAGQRRWGEPTPRGDRHRPGLPLRRGWAVLLLSDVTGETVVDHWCLTTILSVAELTCAADNRPWQWRQVGAQFQVLIGPPPAAEHPSAGQLAADLEHLASGLNPGPWRISAFAGSGNRPHPER